MPDKKISELDITQSVTGDDVSVLVRDGTDYQYSFSRLLTYLANNITTGNSLTFVTALPQNVVGKNFDVALNVSSGSFYQKRNGIWVEAYSISTSSPSAGSILHGEGVPTTNIGQVNDTYIDTVNAVFYHKYNEGWEELFSMKFGPAGARGPKGDQGIPGVNGKSLLNGSINPSNQTTGTDGDFYINTNSYTLFGPKTNNDWGTGKIIIPVNFDEKADKSYVDMIKNALIPHPVYDAPSATLSTSQATTGEVGQTVNMSLNLTFTKRDAGAVQTNGYVIKKSGATVVTDNSYSESIILTTTAISYQGAISYSAGPVKKNILLEDDPVGQIQAGSINSNTINFTGYYASWYGFGATDTVPATSAEARSLQTYNSSNNLVAGKLLTVSGNTFTHRTGTTRKVHSIITAPGKSLSSVVDQDALNKDITDEYIYQGTITVNDVAGNPVTGFKLYVKTMGVAYTTSHRHNITLS